MQVFCKLMLVVAFVFGMSGNAFSEHWVHVPAGKKIVWQMSSAGIIYFRNLNQFNPDFLPCCYNYSLNVNTDGGRAMWSTILAKTAANEEIILGVADQKIAGPITYIGQW